jgi:alpha-tubulin suppressor-like RCC1 family protein
MGDIFVVGSAVNGVSLGVKNVKNVKNIKNGKNYTINVPTKIPFKHYVKQMTAGFTNSLFLTEDGKVYGIGGSLPYMDEKDEYGLIDKIPHADYIACFSRYILYIDNGYLYGYGFFERVFDSYDNDDEPIQLSELPIFKKVYAISEETAYVLDIDGNVYLIGRDSTYLFKRRDKDILYQLPVKNIIDVAISLEHGLLLNDQGEVFTFGESEYGQLGYKSEKYNNPLTKLELPFKVLQISVGDAQSFILSENNQIYGFGLNQNQHTDNLGIDDEENKYEPTLIPGLNNIIKLNGKICMNNNGEIILIGRNFNNDNIKKPVNTEFNLFK